MTIYGSAGFPRYHQTDVRVVGLTTFEMLVSHPGPIRRVVISKRYHHLLFEGSLKWLLTKQHDRDSIEPTCNRDELIEHVRYDPPQLFLKGPASPSE